MTFFPTAEALGSSAITKFSEQTGAAPKPIPPRFPSKRYHGSQGSQGSLKVSKVSKVHSRFPRLDCKGSLKVSKVPK